MYQVCVLLFELGFKVTVSQTVTFQLCDLFLQITDLKSDRPSLSFSWGEKKPNANIQRNDGAIAEN